MEAISGKVLLIEDHEDTLRVMQTACDAMGFEVVSTSNGSVGLQHALAEEFLLILLDVGLPGVDGIEICRRIREKSHKPLVVFVTSATDESARVLGLESGADDYITKPFSVREMSARIRTLLRRRYHDRVEFAAGEGEDELSSGVIQFRELKIDLDQRKIFIRGEEVSFTSIEFNLLLYLVERAGKAVAREELMRHVWGFQSTNFDGTVNSHMSRVRAKLEKSPSAPEYIFTIRGFGYRFADKETASEVIHNN